MSTADCIGVNGFIRKPGKHANDASLYNDEKSVGECQVGDFWLNYS